MMLVSHTRLYATPRRLFSILTGTQHFKSNLPPFMVGTHNGFLPRQEPLITLPPTFAKLEDLLTRMPIKLSDGRPGLLQTGDFGKAIETELPVYDVDGIHDQRLLTALFRDYTFAASAYLLEPCDIAAREGKEALGRTRLPASLAIPLTKVSSKIGAKPFMEYAQSYSLYNYQRKDLTKGLDYPNLDLIRTFSGSRSEHGFILIHVAMVAHSGGQVKHTAEALEALRRRDRPAFNASLKGLLGSLRSINRVMDTMWNHSYPEDYANFRVFIMGTKNQPMFPKGVVYEGVSDTPQFYRGESGANDSMVPSADNFLQVTEQMPENPLTEILRDFRTYRPKNHNEWLAWLEKEARTLGVKQHCLSDTTSSLLYLSLLDQVRDFRNRHWSFTKEYIIKRSTHPVATGGSPITTWLPNQLGAVLKVMVETGNAINMQALSPSDRQLADELLRKADSQSRVLKREVTELSKKFPGQHL